MRFLLVFYSPATDEWRILDTVNLAGFKSGDISHLPAALRRESGLLLHWMLGRYEIIGDAASVPVRWDQPVGREHIEIYPVDPHAPVVPSDGEYRGPWLEILRNIQSPLALLQVRKIERADGDPAFDLLGAYANRPFEVSSDACRETVDKMTEWNSREATQDLFDSPKRLRPTVGHDDEV